MVVADIPPPPPPPPRTTTCLHFVTRKKRQCKLAALPHNQYCAEHYPRHPSTTTIGGEGDPHIPCPLDPAHSILQSRLERHLKKCNANLFDYTDRPYYKQDVNVPVTPPNQQFTLTRAPLGSVDPGLVWTTCRQLLGYGATSRVCEVGEAVDVSSEELVDWSELVESRGGEKGLKHAKQQIALVREYNTGPVEKGRVFVELGAGAGRLSQWFHYKYPERTFVLVDRQMCRRRADEMLSNFLRLKMDIKDVWVRGVEGVREGVEEGVREGGVREGGVREGVRVEGVSEGGVTEGVSNVTYLGKHLCGGATDLCLVPAVRTAGVTAADLIIALCCHNQCTWEVYTGKTHYLSHFTPEQFYLLSSLSGWATCFHLDKIYPENLESEMEMFMKEQGPPEDGGYIVLPNTLKRHIGLCAKNVINDGRAKYLQDNGFDVRFVKYIRDSISLENMALLAERAGPAL
eukprot:sb/3479440/